MGAIRGLWRWRRNPLRRATDLAEAWLALVVMLLVLVAAPVIGSLVGAIAQDSLQRSVREQRADRHAVTATVVKKLKGAELDPDPDSSTARDIRSRVLADWTAPDGTAQHGAVMANLNTPHAGDHFRLWTDRRGHIVAPPAGRGHGDDPRRARRARRGTAGRRARRQRETVRAVAHGPPQVRPLGPGMGAGGPGLGQDRHRQLTAFRLWSTHRPHARYGGPAKASASTRVPRGGGTAAPWHRARSR